jgi:hypothetical protein
MTDPMIIAVAAEVAGRLTESLAAGAKSAVSGLVRAIRNRLATDDEANRALAEADEAPADDDRLAVLAAQMARLAAQDPEFAEQLRSLSVHAERGGIVNQQSGTVSGHVVQARDIKGGVRFGTPQ